MSDLPRLLLCSFEVIPGPTGTSRRVTEYLRVLQEHFSVVVLCAKTPEHSHIEKYCGARLLRVPVGTGDLTSRIQTFERAVRRQLESEEYALAHFLDPFAGLALCERKAELGYKLVYEAQGFPSQELYALYPGTESDPRLLSRLLRQELYCLTNADRIVTGSELTRSYIHGLGVGTQRVHVLRTPVDVARFQPSPPEQAEGRTLEVLYLGSQVSWQGLPCLLDAVALASAQLPVHLRLVGPRHPTYAPSLEALVAALHLESQVEWLPPVPHDALPALLARADVAVAPLEDTERNRVQGGPLAKLAEYLAAGRPVIASDLPLVRAQLPSSAALFHRPGDARALAVHLVNLGRSPSLRRRLGSEGRAFAERSLDSAHVGAQLLALYRELLGQQLPAPAALPPRPPTLPVPPVGGREAETEPAAHRPGPERPTDPGLLPVTPRPAPPPLPPRTISRVGIPALPGPVPARPATPPPAASLAPTDSEPEELSAEELLEVEESPALLEPAASALSPWLAQLAHGYCPPEGTRFTRHTPPTNFPGREADTDPARAAPGAPTSATSRPRPG